MKFNEGVLKMSKLLVVIDYQKDFVDGALGFEKAKNPRAGHLQ